MKPESKPAVPRWKCVCAYDGGAFDGWQSQATGRAVQDVIERQLAKIFCRDVRIHGSGRTDSGVHALGQVFHFDATWTHEPDKLRVALQNGLGRAIQLKSLRRARADFHARFAAKGKSYRYQIFLGEADPFATRYCWSFPRELDWPAVSAAAAVLRGRHDFRAFSANNGTERSTTVRDLRRVDIARRGHTVRFTFEADGFLYKMVRSLTGALISAGQGKVTPREIAEMLKTGQRAAAVHTAPAQGLFLTKVFY